MLCVLVCLPNRSDNVATEMLPGHCCEKLRCVILDVICEDDLYPEVSNLQNTLQASYLICFWVALPYRHVSTTLKLVSAKALLKAIDFLPLRVFLGKMSSHRKT